MIEKKSASIFWQDNIWLASYILCLNDNLPDLFSAWELYISSILHVLSWVGIIYNLKRKNFWSNVM